MDFVWTVLSLSADADTLSLQTAQIKRLYSGSKKCRSHFNDYSATESRSLWQPRRPIAVLFSKLPRSRWLHWRVIWAAPTWFGLYPPGNRTRGLSSGRRSLERRHTNGWTIGLQAQPSLRHAEQFSRRCSAIQPSQRSRGKSRAAHALELPPNAHRRTGRRFVRPRRLSPWPSPPAQNRAAKIRTLAGRTRYT